jgi:hypothetical protein
MSESLVFPTTKARNLEGRNVELPAGFSGTRNVVMIAFQRQHQSLVDSWVPWLEEAMSRDPELAIYEVPTLGSMWIPARSFIDGGMAAAIRSPKILQRTLTVYGNTKSYAEALKIRSRSTITLLVVTRDGVVRWSGTGGFTPESAAALGEALEASR